MYKVDLQIIVTRPHAILKNLFIIHYLSLGQYWLKISFSSPARMELCSRFNLVIMSLYATAHAQIERSLTTLVFACSAIINREV